MSILVSQMCPAFLSRGTLVIENAPEFESLDHDEMQEVFAQLPAPTPTRSLLAAGTGERIVDRGPGGEFSATMA